MKTLVIGLFTLGVCMMTALAQPPEGKGKGPGKKGPPPFEPGKVLPPFVRDMLELTEDQEKKIGDLEKDVRTKLMNILTEEQKQRLQDLRDKGPKGPPKDKDFQPEKGKKKDDDKRRGDPDAQLQSAIQWYASWESGKREAGRTGRPILLVTAAPHCAGVSGTW